jgi:hypothetical protein
MAALAPPLATQGQAPPRRDNYVFYIPVDPMKGDDAQALLHNPSLNGNPLTPLSLHPDTNDANNRIMGVLQHAPFSFKTLEAAITYGRQFVGFRRTIATQPQKEVTVRHVVIHCLPGLYGPVGPELPRIDPQSGLPFNGEDWPVDVPSNVSIQGTSALDTIFDGRFRGTHILGVTEPNQLIFSPHTDTFIDSVTIRNARSGGVGVYGSGAGIYIHHTGTSQFQNGSSITVTNCFINNNVVGIGIDSSRVPTPQVHWPRIINNTIAWNANGLWSGQTQASAQPLLNDPILLNNIFDSGSPPGFIPGISGFEGIWNRHVQVTMRGSTPVNPPQDFNAWEDTLTMMIGRRVNLGLTAVLPNWPLAPVDPMTQPLTAPRVNISPYTRIPPPPEIQRPGTLYINETFVASGLGDHSPHDFRLAPATTRNRINWPTMLTEALSRNPLVDQGIHEELYAPGLFNNITLGAGTLNSPPGLPIDAEGPWPQVLNYTRVDGWDNDAEGWANPRVRRAPWSAVPIIDLGADEMGELIMAGYLNGTRIFCAEAIPGAPMANVGPNHHGRVYFFARAWMDMGQIVNGPYPRPQTNVYDAKVLTDWFAGVQAQPAVDANVGNYTTVQLGVRPGGSVAERREAINQNPTYEAFMRGLECDFTPHLLPDIHPVWGLLTTQGTMFLWSDIYACNPWYDHSGPPVAMWPRRDNPTLFHNYGGSLSTSWGGMFGFPMYVIDATLNPPGTYPQTGRWTIAPTTTFGPYAPCTGSSPTQYTVGSWGIGDTAANCPDLLPVVGSFPPTAARFNCEVLGSQGTLSNLQTFLGIRLLPPPINGARGAPSPSISATERPTLLTMRRLVREALERRQ